MAVTTRCHSGASSKIPAIACCYCELFAIRLGIIAAVPDLAFDHNNRQIRAASGRRVAFHRWQRAGIIESDDEERPPECSRWKYPPDEPLQPASGMRIRGRGSRRAACWATLRARRICRSRRRLTKRSMTGPDFTSAAMSAMAAAVSDPAPIRSPSRACFCPHSVDRPDRRLSDRLQQAVRQPCRARHRSRCLVHQPARRRSADACALQHHARLYRHRRAAASDTRSDAGCPM